MTKLSRFPLVSVILPAYNAERYVADAIESILKQTYTNIEFLIIDDCSTDKTGEIIVHHADRDTRIRSNRNQQNKGISLTLNKGLDLAMGEYIARMDADDVALPDRIQKQVNFLNENREIALVGTAIQLIDERGELIGDTNCITGWNNLKRVIHLRSPLAHPTWMFRRSVLDDITGYRDLPPAEDYDFLLRLVTAGYRFDNLEGVGLLFRLSSTNTESTRSLIQRKAFNYVLSLYHERLETGKDSFTKKRFNDVIKSTRIMVCLHQKSRTWLNKAIIQRRNGAVSQATFSFLLASLLSPYQFQYILRGYLSTKLLR